MLLAQQGLPKSAPDGDAMISSLPMGASRAVEGERLRGAREIDLARTIEAIDAVQKARVHLAVEQPSVFLRDRCAAGRLGDAEAARRPHAVATRRSRAIAHLVASSVPGLAPDAVSIVDQTRPAAVARWRRPGGDASERQIAIQAKIEARYRRGADQAADAAARRGQFHRRGACRSRLRRGAGDARKLSQGRRAPCAPRPAAGPRMADPTAPARSAAFPARSPTRRRRAAQVAAAPGGTDDADWRAGAPARQRRGRRKTDREV